MHPGRPGHVQSFDYRGIHRYFLTLTTDGRHSAFTAPAVVQLVLSHIRRPAGEEQFEISAYRFMPDHVHLLVCGCADASDLKRFVARAKQFAGYYYSRQTGVRLWQRDYYEHVVRDDERCETIARYILENPVRAGLVESFESYDFCGSDVWTKEQLRDLFRGDPGTNGISRARLLGGARPWPRPAASRWCPALAVASQDRA